MALGMEQTSISDFLGEGCEATLRSANPGDLRSAEIAAGVSAQGVSVAMEQGAALHAGFHAAGVDLNMQGGMARPAGWQPDIALDQPETPQVKTTFDV